MRFVTTRPIPEHPSPAKRAGVRVRVCGRIAAATIYMPDPLLRDVVDYAEGDLSRPRGGFLYGYPAQWKGERYVEVRGHIAAEQGVGKGDTFTFTPKFFEEAADQSKTLWPDAALAGWYYTHLKTGIF